MHWGQTSIRYVAKKKDQARKSVDWILSRHVYPGRVYATVLFDQRYKTPSREAKARHGSDSLFEGSQRGIVLVPLGVPCNASYALAAAVRNEHIAQRGRGGEAWVMRRAPSEGFVTTWRALKEGAVREGA